MPNLWEFLNDPLMTEVAKRNMQNSIDSPTLDRGVLEAQIRGFGAGALDGIQELTTPLNLASLLAGGTAGALRRAPSQITTLGRIVPPPGGGVAGPVTGSLEEGGDILRQILNGR